MSDREKLVYKHYEMSSCAKGNRAGGFFLEHQTIRSVTQHTEQLVLVNGELRNKFDTLEAAFSASFACMRQVIDVLVP